MPLFDPLLYLKLENIKGKLIIRREIIAYTLLALFLTIPFIVLNGINYFHKDGFLDKISSLCSILTGFYIASLIGVATLGPSFASMDETITNGIIRRPTIVQGQLGDSINRREYVCLMFGYLAFIALFITLLGMMIVSLSPIIHPFRVLIDIKIAKFGFSYLWIRAIAIFLFSIILSSVVITTLSGLYYLVEKIYDSGAHIDQSR